MSRPTYQQVHIDTPLTNISIAYTPGQFIGSDLFPLVPVVHISDKYFTYTKADWLRNEVGVRAPGTKAPRGDYGLSTSNYFCTEKSIAKGVPDEIVENADNPLRPAEDATKWVTTQLYQKLEIDVAATAFGTGWATSATPSVLWSNDTSDPLGDFATAFNGVLGSIGLKPNVAVVGYGVWRYLKNHPDIVERVKYSAGPTNPAIVAMNTVAALIEVERLMVGTSIQDTAGEGSTSSLSYIWGNHGLLAYVTGGPSLLEPSAGYVFSFEHRKIQRFREDQNQQDVVAGGWSYTANAIAADAAYLLKSVV